MPWFVLRPDHGAQLRLSHPHRCGAPGRALPTYVYMYMYVVALPLLPIVPSLSAPSSRALASPGGASGPLSRPRRGIPISLISAQVPHVRPAAGCRHVCGTPEIQYKLTAETVGARDGDEMVSTEIGNSSAKCTGVGLSEIPCHTAASSGSFWTNGAAKNGVR